MRIWVYPGSFDPVTVGHLDIIERAARLCDRLIVAVLDNAVKKPAFTAQERVDMLKQVTNGLPNVEVAVSDFEMEFQIAAMNRKLAPGVETVFIMTSTEYSFVSSTMAKDVGQHGGDISDLIPGPNQDFVKNALMTRRS
jgi:pantetheine-phosphate adenylyltransferase